MGPLAKGAKILRATSCRRRASPVAIVVISDAAANQIESVIHNAFAGTNLSKAAQSSRKWREALAFVDVLNKPAHVFARQSKVVSGTYTRQRLARDVLTFDSGLSEQLHARGEFRPKRSYPWLRKQRRQRRPRRKRRRRRESRPFVVWRATQPARFEQQDAAVGQRPRRRCLLGAS